MPAKKQKTTLVTEDELVQAVTGRVTEEIKQHIEDRFERFEQTLQRLARPPAIEPQQQATTTRSQSARQDPDRTNPPGDSLGNAASSISQGPTSDVPQPPSVNQLLSNRPLSAQTPLVLDQQPLRDAIFTAPGTSAQDVNINNDNPTWAAWSAAQQRYPRHPPAHYSNYVPDTEVYDPSLDAQVRHLLEATPHQLKGNSAPGPFPYCYVSRGPEKRKLSFNTVSLPEHIYGMFCMIDDKRVDPSIKPDLVEHMKEVAEDACEFEWGGYVRRWSEEVFNLIAEKRLPLGWRATAKIQNLRTGMSRVDSARLTKPDNPRPTASATTTREQGPRRYQQQGSHQPDSLRGGPPCKDFNSIQGCALQSGHTSHGRKQVHVCSYCLLNTAAAHPHSEAQCRTKQRHANAHF